jgi:hypothetical protein
VQLGIATSKVCVRNQRHCGRVQLEARACAAARCSDTRGGSCLWMMCAPQGVPCRGAGGLWVRSGEHAAIAKERAVRMPCACRAIALPGFARHHDHRGWVASSWGSATQHGAGCGVQFVKEREPGSLELDARVQHALRMPSPLLLRGAAWWWGVSMGSAPERGWRREGAVFSTATN